MALDRSEIGAALIGGALGGLVVGLVALVAANPKLRAMGEVVGSPTIAAGIVVLAGTSIVFGLVYAGLVTAYVDQDVSTVLGITTRSDTAKDLVMPLTRRFGMALVVTTAMGLLYGLAVGIVFGGLVLPALSTTLRLLDPVVVAGYVLYGVVLGGTYGKLVMG